MGEYAVRHIDRERVKIGTCEDMFYLRYEDVPKVSYDGSFEGSRFRIPFPDEDHLLPGNYEDHNRGVRLYRRTVDSWCADFADESTIEDPGSIQLRHEASGLLLSIPCYHGQKLPDTEGTAIRAAWNGKGHSFELSSVKLMEGKLYPVVRCRHCRHAWRYEWSDIWDFIPGDIQQALRRYEVQPK